MRILVKNAEEAAGIEKVLQVIQDDKIKLDTLLRESGTTDEYREAFTNFNVENVSVSVTTSGAIDTALIAEIGKTYRAQYDAAKAAGNKELEYKMFGAMMALKNIKDMVEAPPI